MNAFSILAALSLLVSNSAFANVSEAEAGNFCLERGTQKIEVQAAAWNCQLVEGSVRVGSVRLSPNGVSIFISYEADVVGKCPVPVMIKNVQLFDNVCR